MKMLYKSLCNSKTKINKIKIKKQWEKRIKGIKRLGKDRIKE